MKWRVLLVVLPVLAFGAQAQLRFVQAPKETAPPETGYVDRLIEGTSAEQAEEEQAAQYRSDGWPRFLRLETRLGTEPYRDDRVRAGVAVSAGIDTPNYGALSLDTTLFPSDGSSLFTVRQRGLPFEGWLVNNELGLLTPQVLDVMRGNTRVFVPTVLVRGAQTEWLGRDGLQWQASTGELGVLVGYPILGFRDLAGSVSTVGVQGQAGGWGLGARYAYAHEVSNSYAAGVPRMTSHATHLAARREGPNENFQAQVIVAHDENAARTRGGGWIDAEHRVGRASYGWGVFRLDPNLTWAGQSMASDLEGAYVRGAWHTRQVSGSVNVDVLRSITGDDQTGVLVSATGQWRYSRSLTFSAGGTVREYLTDGHSLFADTRWMHDLGRSGARVELSDYPGQERVSRLVLDHDWVLPAGWALSTSAWGGREKGRDASGALWGAAVTTTVPLGSKASFIANANAERRGSGDRFASANVSLLWQLSPRWTIEGSAQYSYGNVRRFVPLDPLAPPERVDVSQDNRSIYLIVRYEDRAGTRAVPLGGSPVGGGGRITGRVFLDANGNGRQEASEQGAAGVTVYLDGRYSARTDAQGRFEFPFVAPGSHAVTVLNETLPLPWESPERADHRVDVRVRDSAEILVPVVRRN